MVIYFDGGDQEWLWGPLRDQPSILTSIVGLIKQPLAFDLAEHLLAELAWQARGRAPEQQLLVDAGMIEQFLACIYRRRTLYIDAGLALPWLALGCLEAREGLAADLDFGRGNPWTRAGAIDSAITCLWHLLDHLEDFDEYDEAWILVRSNPQHPPPPGVKEEGLL